jgi:opacity protein-like surface antigen
MLRGRMGGRPWDAGRLGERRGAHEMGVHMKKFVLASGMLAALALGAPAMAADLPVKAPVYKAPVIAPVVYDWTGFYIGGNIGYSWADWDSTNVGTVFTFPGSPTAFSNGASPNVNGVFGGVQGGYNWQFNPHWLVGIEGDFEWSSEKASDPGAASVSVPSTIGTGICDAHPPCTLTVTGATTNDWKLPWFATLRGRFGYVADQTWLFYGTGGLAIGEMGFSTSATTTATVTNAIGYRGCLAKHYPGRLRNRRRHRKNAVAKLDRQDRVPVSGLGLVYLPFRHRLRHERQAARQHRSDRREL